jgi:carboxylesterase type B
MKSLALCALFAALVVAEDVVVKIANGPIRGIRVDLEKGQYYYAFKGVRYAKPPVDDLRFKAPVAVESWTDVFDATDDGNVCPQYDISNAGPAGDEDCLNLNVYTPKLDSKKRAVLVHFHGGAFIMGGGASYFFGPDYLLNEDVILVTFNYRLGAFGFLGTEDNESTKGNQGLKDQILVLRWVKENIEKFGGDPGKVTLFGEDSGAASASILAMSPLAKDLFHGVIALSGNALCDQYINSNPMEAAQELATRFECANIEKGADIIDCLQRQTQQDIVSKANDMFMFFSFPRWFVPNVDGDVLPDKPETLLKEGKFSKVPFIVGQTKDEGAFFYRLAINSLNNGVYDDNFIDHKLPRLLPIISNFDSKLYPITRSVRKRYFVNVDMENEDEFRPRFVEFLTDLLFTRCTNKFAQMLAEQKVPTYQYVFDYRGQYSIVNLQGEQVDMGVAHGDDLQYVFSNIWGEDLTMSTADVKFAKKVYAPLLANFAKTRNPTPEVTDSLNVKWAPVDPNKTKVYRIGSKLHMEEDYKKDILKFWYEDIPKLFIKKKKTADKKKDEL